MGDRAFCEMSLRGRDKEKIDAILEKHDFEPHTIERDKDLDLWTYQFEEVNYAELGSDLEADLKTFDYDWSWDAGGNYAAGFTYHRADGSELTLYEHDVRRRATIQECLDAIEQLGHEEFVKQYTQIDEGMNATSLEDTIEKEQLEG